MTPTKKPSGQLDWYETTMPVQTVTSAMATDRVIARTGLAVSDLAAAAGPIIRLDIISGRNMTMIAAMDTRPSATMGSTSPWLTPNTSPNSSAYASCAYWLLQLTNSAPMPSIITNVSAVATSGRARRLSPAMPSAPATENTARPANALSPSRLAPAAPVNAPFGMACAANVDPRSTAKNPVTPAITATAVAAIQVFSIRPVTIPAPCPGSPAGPHDGRAGAGT